MSELYNRDIKEMLELVEDFKREMRESQSARLHVGYIPADKRRAGEILTAIKQRIDVAETCDFPESHPVVLETVATE